MASGTVVFVRHFPDEDRIEITLRPRFTWGELDVVRALPGRKYDPERRIWIAPSGRAAIATLTDAFGAGGVAVAVAAAGAVAVPMSVSVAVSETASAAAMETESATVSGRASTEPDSPTEAACGPPGGILDRIGDALTVRGYSPRTRKAYLGHLRRFLEWCGGGVPMIPEDPAEGGQAYILELIQEKDVSRGYQNQVVSAVRFFFEAVLGRPRLAMSIPRPRKEQRLPAVMSPEEVACLLGKTRNLKHRALLMLLYSAGLRVGELVNLTPPDLDPERGVVRVRGGKGRKDRYTLLARRAVEAVNLYRDAYPTDRWLFPGDLPGRHLTTRSVQRVVKNAAAAAGIEKRVTAHTLRHSFATHLLEGGTNLRVIQELLGHQSARTTQIYTHVAKSLIESVRSPLDNL